MTDPVLELNGYGVCFGRRVILSDITLFLPQGEVSVLMGPVKTGKSTLMRSLAGLNDGNALFRRWGEATLQGKPVADGWRPSLVQQHATLLKSSVRDALIHPLRGRNEKSPAGWCEAARVMLTTYGLEHLTDRLDAPMLDLPEVWRKAVLILGHVLLKPPLLLVDEPTYGMNETDAIRLIDWLRQVGRSTKLWVALHHQGQARRLAQHIVLIGGGRALFSGPGDRFFSNPQNTWAEQFVRTGSLSIPSPDARREDLADDVEPPPPLPAAALRAIADFDRAETVAAASVVTSVPIDATAGDSVARESGNPQPSGPGDVATGAPATSATSSTAAPEAGKAVESSQIPPASATAQKPAKLPPISAGAVEAASMVGVAIYSDYRGPQGFHWIIPGRLAGCAEPGVVADVGYDLSLLRQVGVTYLVTLTEKDLDKVKLQEHQLRNIHLPIFDREAPTIGQAYMLVRHMQRLLDKGEVLAVHCKAGIGRTGTILAAWLIREGGMSAATAIERLRRINPAYVQTETQEAFLREFEDDIVKRIE